MCHKKTINFHRVLLETKIIFSPFQYAAFLGEESNFLKKVIAIAIFNFRIIIPNICTNTLSHDSHDSAFQEKMRYRHLAIADSLLQILCLRI